MKKYQRILSFTSILFLLISPGFSQIKLTVNPESEVRPISPYIYGRNNSFSSTDPTAQMSAADLTRIKDAGVRFFRENGGNNSTKYNWRKKLSSHPDWYNNIYTNDWDNVVLNMQKNFPSAQGMWAFQLIGWVAANNQNNFNDWNYNGSKWWEGVNQNLAGNGVLNPTGTKAKVEGNPKLYLEPWPADSSTAILSHWFDRLKVKKENARYWNMDNEPEIWNGTHDDVMPSLITAEEFIQRYIKMAISARARFPEIKLTGPVTANEWQWYNWNNDAVEYNGKKYNWTEYFIMRLVEEEKKTGVRMFDVIDLHFYPSTSSPAEIAQLHRVFFDKNYVYPEANGLRRLNGGWDTSQNKEYIFGRINGWLDQYLGNTHDRTLALTESGINTEDANLSAIWYASTMGEFMKNGVEIFTPWSWKPGMWEVMHLTSNYNKAQYCSGTSDSDEKVGIYPSKNSNGDSLSLLIINKTATIQSVSVSFDQYILDSDVPLIRIQDLPKAETFVSKSQNALVKETIKPANNKLNVTLKPYSVTIAMVKGHKGIYQEATLGTENREEVIVFPNPAEHQLNIELPGEEIKSLEILDMSGRVVLKGKSPKMILPEYISKGTYFIRIDTGQKTVVKKLIVN
ncbi:MAG: T9SS type A sorting domain-containing protein [Cytophagaceae bacterium]|nr:T9SS type A sorting domain-containing protein [Cytophagaceae bacterium]MBL0304115.1 T9SS type A sorting domain-containing protein [Cytophagaceae bacterium]MBL0326925.1 T9SS type A sorting domain-containing protein [Cytophagaceae bacterium]